MIDAKQCTSAARTQLNREKRRFHASLAITAGNNTEIDRFCRRGVFYAIVIYNEAKRRTTIRTGSCETSFPRRSFIYCMYRLRVKRKQKNPILFQTDRYIELFSLKDRNASHRATLVVAKRFFYMIVFPFFLRFFLCYVFYFISPAVFFRVGFFRHASPDNLGSSRRVERRLFEVR